MKSWSGRSGPLPVTRADRELGEELAPNLSVIPLYPVTIGQMRQCLEAGGNTIIMGRGQGGAVAWSWYAELQEIMLQRAGYDFKMLVIDSTFSAPGKLRFFLQTLNSFFDPGCAQADPKRPACFLQGSSGPSGPNRSFLTCRRANTPGQALIFSSSHSCAVPPKRLLLAH